MACDRCGKCCTYVAVAVPDTDGWLLMHGLPSEDGVATLKFKALCIQYDPYAHLCLDYENRPQVCKDYLCPLAKEAS